MPQMFLSYRRDDATGVAGRIFDRLVAEYGKESVFMDVDTIPPGTDFRGHLFNVLQQCDLMLAIIGPRWAGLGENMAVSTRPMTTCDSRSKRRFGAMFELFPF